MSRPDLLVAIERRSGRVTVVLRGELDVQQPFSSAGLDGLLPFVDGPPG